MTFDPNTATIQAALNTKNQGVAGYIPLKVDGLNGPLTQAAVQKYGYNTQTGQPNTPVASPIQSGTNSNVGSQMGAIPTPTTSPSTTPSSTTTGTPTPPPTSTPTSTNPYLAQVQALSQLSPAEVDAQNQINTLQGGYKSEIANSNDQPQMPVGLLSGHQAAAYQQEQAGEQTLQSKLALAQAQRQASLDAAKASLGATMPTSLAYGAQLVNPLTGTTVNGGIFGSTPSSTGTSGATGINPTTGLTANSSTADILGYLSTNGINPTRYDMPGLINAIQNGATAQDIISGKVNVAAATAAGTSGSTYKLNPLTGTYQQPAPVSTSTGNNLGGFSSTQAVKTFQTANGLKADGIVGPQTIAAMQKAGMTVPSASPTTGGTSGASPSTSGLPTPTTYAQKSFATDFTSGGLADKINAQNTAVGHLTAAYDLAQQMNNWNLQPGNAGKNWLATKEGKAAVDNYKLAHAMSSAELASAYGQGTGGERDAVNAIGGSNGSPEQLKGFVQTSAALLSSKILSNIQQYKTAYGTNAPINLDWFIAPDKRQALSNIGIQIHQDGNNFGAYQLQKDGSYKKI